MKTIYLNVLEGCKNEERLDLILKFISDNNPDILALSELNGWENNKLQEFLAKTNFKHHIFHRSKTGFHLGLFSKEKIIKSETINENMWHGFIKAEFEEFEMVLTHSDPFTEEKRLNEIEEILKILNLNKKIILLGDLNSLSPKDEYDEEKLLKILKEKNIKKFGQNKLKKDVQTKLLDAGLIDAVREFSDEFEYTVPTEYNKDEFHFEKLRLDYIYISKSLRPFLKNAKIIRNEETNQLSDHFPIMAEFDFT
tara:strand:- start:3638 stop:4396 length:759 start_codon:yes stop_codon:yes gene_type:complete